ncbi:MAG TPA: sodium/proton-translocating pyrophosphatase, partial [Acidobacteriota bacterium]|nr:sodium/proton-translocating pyrophosphatase [Acidobacteriota bacterium]
MDYVYVLPFVLVVSLAALAVAFLFARQVLAADRGTPEMRAIAAAIQQGAEAFIARQYRTIAVLALAVAAVIFAFYFANRGVRNIAEMGAGAAWKVTLSFLVGAVCSAAARSFSVGASGFA